MPEGKGREVTFYTCTACHGVALIKAQGLTRELWDNTFDTMLEKHRMPPVKTDERAEILDYLAEQFPPRRKGARRRQPVPQVAAIHFSDQACSGRKSRSSSWPSAVSR